LTTNRRAPHRNHRAPRRHDGFQRNRRDPQRQEGRQRSAAGSRARGSPPSWATDVGDSPEGLKKPGESCLKPAKNKTKHTSNLSTHTRRGPRCGGPRSPPEWPNQAPLERVPPRSRAHAPLERAPPHSRLPHERTCSLRGYEHLML
jgi:hypothetical protein